MPPVGSARAVGSCRSNLYGEASRIEGLRMGGKRGSQDRLPAAAREPGYFLSGSSSRGPEIVTHDPSPAFQEREQIGRAPSSHAR